MSDIISRVDKAFAVLFILVSMFVRTRTTWKKPGLGLENRYRFVMTYSGSFILDHGNSV